MRRGRKQFQIEDVVYARWWKHKNKKRNVKYKAKVRKVNIDDTYDILYDNEKTDETRVPSTYMAKEDNEESAKQSRRRKRHAEK